MDYSVDDAQAIATRVEQYLQAKKLYYGQEPRANGDASWMVALNNHDVHEGTADMFLTVLPRAIGAYHQGCRVLLDTLFVGLDAELPPTARRLKKYLTTGSPIRLTDIWRSAAQGQPDVFSTRPDVVVDVHEQPHIIEYNTDGGADKGNTHGVNAYAGLVTGQPILGRGLAQLFIDSVRDMFADQPLVVATVLPDQYRTEYEAQNKYFAAVATEYGKSLGVTWVTVRLSDLEVTNDEVVTSVGGTPTRIHVIDREFKLPGFVDEHDFARETLLLDAVADKKVAMLGTCLPMQDKVLLSTIFDDEFAHLFGDSLQDLRAVHAETGVLDPDLDNVKLDTEYSLQAIRDCATPFDLVLKMGGDTAFTTGSKSVMISTDCSKQEWVQAIDAALASPLSGGHYWVVQRYYPSARFGVHHIKNSRSKPRHVEAIARIAPYYVRAKAGFELGNVLVTSGTDEETYKKQLANIHGLRGNTYQAVAHTKPQSQPAK